MCVFCYECRGDTRDPAEVIQLDVSEPVGRMRLSAHGDGAGSLGVSKGEWAVCQHILVTLCRCLRQRWKISEHALWKLSAIVNIKEEQM